MGGRRLERSRLRSDRSRGAPGRRSTDRAYAGAQLATYVCSATRGKDARGDALSGGMQKTTLQADRWNPPASDRRETDRSQAAVGNGGLE